jgi:hypothetical protein
MRLTMQEWKKATAIMAPRYQKARKKGKGLILDEFVELTGYVRCYAAYVLRYHGRRVAVNRTRTLVGDVGKKVQRQRARIYDDAVKEALTRIWYIMDCICGKRLAPVLGEVLRKLERFKEIRLDQVTRQKLLRISSATIDRLLASERRKQTIKGRGTTKPGTLLKHQIALRTFSEWDEQSPGFVEIDLVGHDGGDIRGEFLYTLDVTDVCTGWTETQAVRNRAQVWVFEALKDIRGRLPFPLLGIDSDNGSEFINNHLLRYCRDEQLTFTRSRSYRKNDNCFVEQKNYSIVRRAVGYLRYDTEHEQRLLNELYGYTRLYTNFFQPVMKLLQKTRKGSKVKKTYDKPRTPYQRVLESLEVPKQNKEQLKEVYATLNPAALKRQIIRLQNKLLAVASQKETSRRQDSSLPTEHTTISGGYLDMGRAEKTACRASCEAEPCRPTAKTAARGR